MNNFVPLRIVSCYSFLQSGLTIERIQNSVIKNEYFGMGLCDNGVMYGVPPFAKAGDTIKKPYIIGLEVHVLDDILCLYAINEEGYHHLMEISTAIQKEQLTYDSIKEKANGLVAIIETINGKFKELFTNDDPNFNKYLFDYSETFKSGFYLGLEVTKKEDVSYANKIRKFAVEHTYECIAFPKILYQKKDDAIVLKIVEAIANDDTLEIEKLEGQQYFMSIEAYQKIYRKAEIDNTRKVLELSSFNFHQKRGEMLHYPVADSVATLKENCYKALEKLNFKDNPVYTKRLEYELETIISMGYADYFLIVQDYVSYAKNHDILVGPGRGSAAGSLVSYLLDITQIDPIANDLQFERFLNPYRKSMPDIDVDFMDIRRDEVIQYMRDKYGNNRVANITALQTIQAKQSLRDIGRVYNIDNDWINKLSKLIGKQNVSLREAYKTIPEFKSLVDSDSYFLNIVSLASKIEGLIRQNSLHAAGIILNDSALENALPVLVDFSEHYISQYEMDCLEEQGFLKMDFLGLRNLTTISYCVDMVNAHYPEAKLDKQNLPFDDPKIYELISSGQTIGLFQIETPAMRRVIKIMKPKCFEEVVALIALNRPGPKAFIPTYAKRKDGKEAIIYDDPCLEPILKSTYGIIVYQEQVNMIATDFAGFSTGEADLFRSAISKKKLDKLLEGEKQFKEGALKKGHDIKTVNKIYESFKRFASYGFNKAHSTVYATIACQMAYLKTFYPLEFYAAILETSSSANDVKFNAYVSEMRKRGFAIIAPNINLSTNEFTVYENGLLYPIGAIHGVSALLANAILEERKNGPFNDFFDFVARMYREGITDKQIISLIDAGCFDCFNASRASYRASVISALQFAELINRKDGQLSIGISDYLKPYLVEDHDDPIENLNREYEVLGIMISNSPLRYKADILRSKDIISITDAKEKKTSKIAGIIRNITTITTTKGSNMAFITIADETDEIELTVFPELYKKNLNLLKKNNIVIFELQAKIRNENIDYIANTISALEDE